MHYSTEIKTRKLCHANYLLHNFMIIADPALGLTQSVDNAIIPFTDYKGERRVVDLESEVQMRSILRGNIWSLGSFIFM